MGIIAYPPVLNAKRIPPLLKAFAAARRKRLQMAESAGYNKEFARQARAANAKQAQEAKERAEKLEARRLGLLEFQRRAMPEWAVAIVDEVCQRRDMCPGALASRTRKHKVAAVRNEAIYLIKARKSSISGPRLGRWFDRDNTSILHSLARHSEESGLPRLVGYDLDNVRDRYRRKMAGQHA
ncbi:MAG: hypothetical protein E5X94_00700 [Mesorhizobium sp.]